MTPRASAILLAIPLVIGAVTHPAAAAAPSCGKPVSRWSVKTGTDADASRVDQTQRSPTTIAQMITLPKPAHRPLDQRLATTETTVFAIDATLTQFGRETDSDYHLVISDANGVTMIVEIPLPACVLGPSPLKPGIEAARAAFEREYGQVKGGVKDAKPPRSVHVVGVGFFDKAHHGKGSADNGIELHPVLEITFDGAPTGGPIAVGVGSQLIQNTGFEDPTEGPWTADAGIITNDDPKHKANSGRHYAWLGGYGSTNTESLEQDVTLPSSANTITLSFYIRVQTSERTKTQMNDTLSVQLQTPQGAVLTTLAEYTNLNASRAYEQHTFNITTFGGKHIALVFIASENGSKQTSFFVDDCAINVQ